MADLRLEDLTPEQLEAYKEELRKQGLGGALKSVENVTGADLQGRSVLADMVAGGDWYNPLSWGKKDPVQAGREAETKALGAFEGVGGPPDTQWTPEEYLPGG